MFAERRIAFERRIGELLQDHRAAYPASRNVSNNQWRDIASRILSALEDSFQMGRKDTNGAEPARSPLPAPMTDRNAADE